ncbi:NgoMIV family type II restriction endonuclease [Corynebacterium sp. HMSC11D10]
MAPTNYTETALLTMLTEGNRLRDISDLPLDLIG